MHHLVGCSVYIKYDCVYVCVCVYKYTCVCARVRDCVCVCLSVCLFACLSVYTCVRVIRIKPRRLLYTIVLDLHVTFNPFNPPVSAIVVRGCATCYFVPPAILHFRKFTYFYLYTQAGRVELKY